MPKVSIGALGIEVDTEPTSAISRYFRNALSLVASGQGASLLTRFAETPLKEAKIEGIRLGLSVERDVDVGDARPEWTIEAGAAAGLAFVTEPGQSVFPSTTFGDEASLTVRDGKAIAGFNLEARVGAQAGLGAGDLAFGFAAGTVLTAASYRCLDDSTSLRTAIAEVLSSFRVPGDWEDLLSLPVNDAMTVGGGGRLTFSISGEFASSVNPLAVTVPAVDVDVKVNTGASVFVGTEAEVSTEYELRVVRSDNDTVLLGYHKEHGARVEVRAGAKAGAAVSVGGFDIASRLISVVAGSTEADAEFLGKAGLSESQIESIEATVRDAVNRKIEASLDGAFSRLRSEEAAFLFRIDLKAVDEAGRSAVRRALDGDLRGLTGDAHLAGITRIRTIDTETWRKSVNLRVNLLGIFNYVSVTELVKRNRVLVEPQTGEIIITDEATAERIRASILHTEANPDRLRKVLQESFLITATYCGSRLLRSAPEVTSRHTYFELHGKTNPRILKDYVDVALALGLVAGSGAVEELVKEGIPLGRSALYVETGYPAPVMRDLFFDSAGRLRTKQYYVDAGCRALALLVQPGDDNDFRRLLAEPEVWQAIETAGSGDNAHRAIARFRQDLAFPAREAIYSDYRTIAFWADSLVNLGETLAEIDRFFQEKASGVDRDDKRLNRHRQRLRDRLADMAEKTKEKWGDPWGLVAVDLASGQRATAHLRITTNVGAYEAERPVVTSQGGT